MYLSAEYAHLYRYIKTIYIKDTQRTADINTHKVKVAKVYFFLSLSLHSSFTAFVYRLHPPLLSFKSVASLESSNTSMWHSKGPYKRCLCVRHKNVPSNHFHSERRGCERKKRAKERGLKQRSVCFLRTMFNQILLRAAFPKRSVCLKEPAFESCTWPCFSDVCQRVMRWRLSTNREEEGCCLTLFSLQTISYHFFLIYQVCRIFWDRLLLTASEQDSALTADFSMYFDVKDRHCGVHFYKHRGNLYSSESSKRVLSYVSFR